MQNEPIKERLPTFRQIKFVNEYVRCLNATESARRAGYTGAPWVIGPRLLGNVRVRKLVEKEMAKEIMQPKEILKRLSAQANANLLPFIRITDDGKTEFDFSHPESKDHFHIIKKLKTKRKREVVGKGEDAVEWEHEWIEVELHDSQAALEKMARHWALFHDKVEIPQLDQLTEALKLIAERQANGSKPATSE